MPPTATALSITNAAFRKALAKTELAPVVYAVGVLHACARRYADGRMTYVPSLVNGRTKQLQTLGILPLLCEGHIRARERHEIAPLGTAGPDAAGLNTVALGAPRSGYSWEAGDPPPVIVDHIQLSTSSHKGTGPARNRRLAIQQLADIAADLMVCARRDASLTRPGTARHVNAALRTLDASGILQYTDLKNGRDDNGTRWALDPRGAAHSGLSYDEALPWYIGEERMDQMADMALRLRRAAMLVPEGRRVDVNQPLPLHGSAPGLRPADPTARTFADVEGWYPTEPMPGDPTPVDPTR